MSEPSQVIRESGSCQRFAYYGRNSETAEPTNVNTAKVARNLKLAADFPVGSLVRLASGGPEMTVVGIVFSGEVLRCAWYDGEVHHSECLSATVLKRADDPERPMTRVAFVPEGELLAAIRSIVRKEMDAERAGG